MEVIDGDRELGDWVCERLLVAVPVRERVWVWERVAEPVDERVWVWVAVGVWASPSLAKSAQSRKQAQIMRVLDLPERAMIGTPGLGARRGRAGAMGRSLPTVRGESNGLRPQKAATGPAGAGSGPEMSDK